MASTFWIKLYHEILDDPKMGTLPDRLYRRVIELFLIAGRNGTTGDLPDEREISWTLRITLDDLLMDLHQLESVGIVTKKITGWSVVNFEKRQRASTAQERKAAQRDRERSQQYSGSVTEDVTKRDKVVRENRIELEKNRDRAEESDGGGGSASPQTFFPGSRSERIYCAVTNHPGIPGSEIDKTIDAIERIVTSHQFKDQEAVDFLKPYWEAAKVRYGRNPGRCFWIYDWAMTEQDPEELKKPVPKKDNWAAPSTEVYHDVRGNPIRL